MPKPSRFISIKVKIFGLIAALIALVVIAVSWRAYVVFKEDKGQFVKELSARLASSTEQTLNNRISSFQDKLIIFISSRESLIRTGAKQEDQLQVLFSRYPEFLSVGLLKPDGKGLYTPEWFARNPSKPSTKWANGFEKSLLNPGTGFDFKTAAQFGRLVASFKDPEGKRILALIFGVDVVDVKKKGAGTAAGANKSETVKTFIVGFMPESIFDDLVKEYAVGVNTVFIVDENGVVIAHSDASQKGQSYINTELVREVSSRSKPNGAGEYKDPKGEQVLAGFKSDSGINLSVIATTPLRVAFEAVNQMSQFIMLVALIILVIALFVALIFSNLLTENLKKLSEVAGKIGSGDFKATVDIKTRDEVGLLADSFKTMGAELQQREDALAVAQQSLVQSEKMSAFGQLSAGIAHEVKNPLAGILGHAQLAMGKAQNDDMKKHLDVIEKETRRCKTIIESLMKFARAEKTTLVSTDLAEVVQATIDLVDHQVSLAGCKIFKEIDPCPKVNANGNQLQQVLLNLIMNASHALDGRPTKHITVRLKHVGDKAQIQIQDTGVGIPPAIQKKIFEPFFTTKPAGKGTGLGLSVSIGIVKEHKADIYLKSEEGQGTTFFIDFPLLDAATASAQTVADAKSAPTLQTPTASKPQADGRQAASIAATSKVADKSASVPSAPQAPMVQSESVIPQEPVTGTTSAHGILPTMGVASINGEKTSGGTKLPPAAPPADDHEEAFSAQSLKPLPKQIPNMSATKNNLPSAPPKNLDDSATNGGSQVTSSKIDLKTNLAQQPTITKFGGLTNASGLPANPDSEEVAFDLGPQGASGGLKPSSAAKNVDDVAFPVQPSVPVPGSGENGGSSDSFKVQIRKPKLNKA